LCRGFFSAPGCWGFSDLLVPVRFLILGFHVFSAFLVFYPFLVLLSSSVELTFLFSLSCLRRLSWPHVACAYAALTHICVFLYVVGLSASLYELTITGHNLSTSISFLWHVPCYLLFSLSFSSAETLYFLLLNMLVSICSHGDDVIELKHLFESLFFVKWKLFCRPSWMMSNDKASVEVEVSNKAFKLVCSPSTYYQIKIKCNSMWVMWLSLSRNMSVKRSDHCWWSIFDFITKGSFFYLVVWFDGRP
jgi:hypothetical protein